MKASHLAAFLALSGVAILPACSMFGGNGNGGRQADAAATSHPGYVATPNSTPTQQMASSQVTPDMIRNVQQNLKQAGLYKGRADGVWGPQTGAAVRDFQQQHNINATGELDQPTLNAMNLGTNNTDQSNAAGQNNQNGGQSQTYGSNASPPNNNSNGQANYNPPPPADTNNSSNSANRTP